MLGGSDPEYLANPREGYHDIVAGLELHTRLTNDERGDEKDHPVWETTITDNETANDRSSILGNSDSMTQKFAREVHLEAKREISQEGARGEALVGQLRSFIQAAKEEHREWLQQEYGEGAN